MSIYEAFCVISFFGLLLSPFHFLETGLHNFFIYGAFYIWCFQSDDLGYKFEKLIVVDNFFFSYYFFNFVVGHWFFIQKLASWFFFQFFFIGLSRSYNIGHRFGGLTLIARLSIPRLDVYNANLS
jgi:hypothetical protein